LNGRAQTVRRIIAASALSALAVTVSVQSASHAEPSIEDVQQRVDNLYHEAEVAQEQLNDVRHQMQGKTDRLTSLRRDLKTQRAAVERMGDVVAATIADEAQSGGGFGDTGRLLFSDDPDEVIDGMVATEAFSQHQGAMLTEFATESDKLALREQQVEAELADLAADREQVAAHNDTVEDKLAEAKELLAELEAEERERLRRQREAAARAAAAEAAAAREAAEAREAEQSRPEPEARPQAPEPSRSDDREPISTAPVSDRAAAAVDFALAQVGDAYVYGAGGPDAWDCSGLTMGAWGAAGVSLPHSSSAQMSSGTPVSRDQLQPGDLVFYYSPVSHVGMYIGNGQLVHAANPSSGVEVVGVDVMPYSGAVRPG